MRETEKLGAIMNVLIDNCDECPLEKIWLHRTDGT